jgi:hypothetical protein
MQERREEIPSPLSRQKASAAMMSERNDGRSSGPRFHGLVTRRLASPPRPCLAARPAAARSERPETPHDHLLVARQPTRADQSGQLVRAAQRPHHLHRPVRPAAPAAAAPPGCTASPPCSPAQRAPPDTGTPPPGSACRSANITGSASQYTSTTSTASTFCLTSSTRTLTSLSTISPALRSSAISSGVYVVTSSKSTSSSASCVALF